MMLIVIGSSRAEMIKVKKRDYEKHFLVTRGQLYKLYPDGLERCFVYDYGVRKDDEEMIVYPENGIIPYHPRRQMYTMAKILSEIDNHKNCIGGKRGFFGDPLAAMGAARSIWRELSLILPFIVAGVVLLWAMVFQ